MRIIALRSGQYTNDGHVVEYLNAGDVVSVSHNAGVNLIKHDRALRVPDDANVTDIAYFIKFAMCSAAQDYNKHGLRVVKEMVRGLF